MADDFQVGDVVVCVDDSPCRAPDAFGEPWPFAKGSIWRVSHVLLSQTPRTLGNTLLRFHGGPPQLRPWKRGWDHKRFRKLPKADEQFTADMRACRPHRHRVPA